jgi:hypothetical protein
MNPTKEKRLNPCQGSDAYSQRKRYFTLFLDILTLVWLAFVILHFVRV